MRGVANFSVSHFIAAFEFCFGEMCVVELMVRAIHLQDPRLRWTVTCCRRLQAHTFSLPSLRSAPTDRHQLVYYYYLSFITPERQHKTFTYTQTNIVHIQTSMQSKK